MAQVQPYEHDIFISYAHIDDTPLMTGEEGWVSEFHKTLEALVKQILGEELEVWRDPKLQGNDYFSDTLVEAVPQAAILVSIISPRYLKSEWCLRELERFTSVADADRLTNKSRVFKVVKTPIERAQEPSPLNQLLGYEFFTVDEASGRPSEFRIEFGPEAKQHYLAKLYDLAYEIADTLKQLSNSNAENVEPTSNVSIYLAETTSDLSEQRESVKAELRQLGYTVLPDQALPIQSERLHEVIKANLDQCVLSIHMIGENYSFIPEGDKRSIVRLQNDIAVAQSKNHSMQRIIWMPIKLMPKSENQQKLVEFMQTDSDSIICADLLKTNLEELKSVIQDKLKQPKASKAANDDALDSKEIYLVCDLCDYDATTPLADYLFDQGHEVILPVFEGDETEVREDHTDKLLASDIIIIYQGKASDLWLSSKLRDLKKLPGYDGCKPKLAKVIFAGAPVTPQKERLRAHDAIIIKHFETFTSECLKPLVSEIEKIPAGNS